MGIFLHYKRLKIGCPDLFAPILNIKTAMESFLVTKKSRLSGLEDIRPTDAIFEAALESGEQLFPPTLEEKEDAQRKRVAADSCYSNAQSEDDFAE